MDTQELREEYQALFEQAWGRKPNWILSNYEDLMGEVAGLYAWHRTQDNYYVFFF